MANGNAAIALIAPARSPKDTPTAATAIETEIGDLVTQAAMLLWQAARKRMAGQETFPTSLQVGERIAKLYALQQLTPGFAAIVAREGRRALRAVLAQNEDLCRRDDLDQTLDEILSWPLGILSRVTESERAFAN
jgi:hypothetical protein